MVNISSSGIPPEGQVTETTIGPGGLPGKEIRSRSAWWAGAPAIHHTVPFPTDSIASKGQQRMLQCPPKEPLKRKADIPMGSKDCWAELRRSEAEHPCWTRRRELQCPKQAER